MIWKATLAAAVVVVLAGLGVGMALGGQTGGGSSAHTTTTTMVVTHSAVTTVSVTTTSTSTMTVAMPVVMGAHGSSKPPGGTAAVGTYVAQFGMFRSVAPAEQLSGQLAKRGIGTQILSSSAYHATPPVAGGYWLVVSQPFASYDDAQAYADVSGVDGAFARTLMPAR